MLIHLDAVGGIAGDMFVAALLDAFADIKQRVIEDGTAVLPPDVGTVSLEPGMSAGITALRFGLSTGAGHGHDSGTYRDLLAAIERAPLHPGTAEEAAAILTVVAEAEAAIHGITLEKVHFHEIADWDSLLDVVCAGSIAAALKGARWRVSPLPRGGGLVNTAHGMLPVPAPATARILNGFAWRDDGVEGERVTPTGAAILKHLVKKPPERVAGRLAATGTGAGTRTLEGIPNILRVLAFEEEADQRAATDRVAVIEFDVDDMTGEEIAVAADRLRASDGVIDLSFAGRFGKKGRPLQAFRILARPEARDAVARRCLEETSTLGLRLREEDRLVLPRRMASADGVRVKIAKRPGGEETRKAESDDISAGADLAARRRAGKRAEHDDG